MKFPERDYEDQAHRIVDNAVKEAAPVYRVLGKHFLTILSRAGDFLIAHSEIDRHGASRDFIEQNQSLLFDGLSTEDALGRSYIVEKDIHYSALRSTSAAKMVIDGVTLFGDQAGWFACKDVNISFDLTPQDVVDYLRTKAFWITGIENDEVLKVIQKRLTEAVNDGKTYQQFLAETEQYFTELPNSRPQTVYRTNLYSAYSMAQLEQVDQMRDRFPMWRYVAILDSATRPDHAALNGEVFPVGQGPYPPIDYNCRCTAQQLHTYQVDAERIKPSRNVQLPETVRRFDTYGEYETWLARKQAGMNPSIRGLIQGEL